MHKNHGRKKKKNVHRIAPSERARFFDFTVASTGHGRGERGRGRRTNPWKEELYFFLSSTLRAVKSAQGTTIKSMKKRKERLKSKIDGRRHGYYPTLCRWLTHLREKSHSTRKGGQRKRRRGKPTESEKESSAAFREVEKKKRWERRRGGAGGAGCLLPFAARHLTP